MRTAKMWASPFGIWKRGRLSPMPSPDGDRSVREDHGRTRRAARELDKARDLRRWRIPHHEKRLAHEPIRLAVDLLRRRCDAVQRKRTNPPLALLDHGHRGHADRSMRGRELPGHVPALGHDLDAFRHCDGLEAAD